MYVVHTLLSQRSCMNCKSLMMESFLSLQVCIESHNKIHQNMKRTKQNKIKNNNINQSIKIIISYDAITYQSTIDFYFQKKKINFKFL